MKLYLSTKMILAMLLLPFCINLANSQTQNDKVVKPNKNDQISSKKEKISYLGDIIKGLSGGVEKQFFLALEKHESQHPDLIEAFNLFQYKDLQPLGTIQMPEKEPEPTFIDWGGTLAMTNRPKLRWEKSIIKSNESFRLLFFQVTPPTQIRPTCDAIILITDTNFKIRTWTKAGCNENFIWASIEKIEGGYIFKVFSKLNNGAQDLRIHQYKITSNKIIECKSVT